jgi:IS4 transposase
VTIERKNQSNLRVITNRFDLSAQEIGEMYQSRWQIELFFKHIKQHMTIKTFFSKSEKGVENQVILAMIVYLLTLLVKLELGLKQTLFQILRHLRALHYESFDVFKEIFEPD